MTAPSLQASIARYLQAVNTGDVAAFQQSFAEDAFVLDVDREIRGLEAIGEWARTNVFAVDVRLGVVKVTESEGRTVITVRVDGTFDRTGLPDPLLMSQAFTVSDGEISELRIAFAS